MVWAMSHTVLEKEWSWVARLLLLVAVGSSSHIVLERMMEIPCVSCGRRDGVWACGIQHWLHGCMFALGSAGD